MLHVVAMVGQVLGVDEDIVNVNNDKPLEELLIHETLKYGG